MTAGGERLACPLCGARWTEAEGRACRGGCPLGAACGHLRCPRCGYELPAPTRLSRWLRRRLGGRRKAS